nr:tetratricopeptide repeat protein [Candidatus Freyarchaeota archaeon]
MDPAGANRSTGLNLLRRGDFKNGIKYLVDARNMYASVDNRSMVANVDLDIASAMFDLGRFDEFIKCSKSAKEYFEAEGINEMVGTISLTIIAQLFGIEGYDEEVLENLLVAKPIFEKLREEGVPTPAPYPLIMSELELRTAFTLHFLGRWEEALPHFEKAKEMLERMQPSKNYEMCEEFYARALIFLGRFDEAIKHLEIVKEINKGRGDQRKVAQIESELGECYLRMVDFKQAIKCFERELLIYKTFGQKQRILIAEYTISKAKQLMSGKIKKALTNEEKEQLREAYKLTSTGGFLKDNERFVEAVEVWKKASKMHEELGNMEYAASLRMSLGLLLVQIGKMEEALEQFSEAGQISAGLGMKMEQAMLENTIAYRLRDAGRTRDAIDHMEKARSIFQILKNQREVARVDKELSIMLDELGLINEAIAKRHDAISGYEKMGDEAEVANSEEMMAFLLCKAHRPEEALKHVSNAKKIYKKLGMRDRIELNEKIERTTKTILAAREAVKKQFEGALLPTELEELQKSITPPLKPPKTTPEIDYGEVVNNLTRFEDVFKHIEPESGFMFRGVDPISNMYGIGIEIAKREERFSDALKHLELMKSSFEKADKHFRLGVPPKNVDMATIDRDMEAFKDTQKLQYLVQPVLEEASKRAKAAREEYKAGVALLEQRKPEEALKHLELAREFFKLGNQQIELGEINLAIVLALGELGRVEEAGIRLKESKHPIVMLGRITDVVYFEKYIGGLLLKNNMLKKP